MSGAHGAVAQRFDSVHVSAASPNAEQDFSKAVDKVEEESLLLLRKCAYSILALLLSGILWSWSFKVKKKKRRAPSRSTTTPLTTTPLTTTPLTAPPSPHRPHRTRLSPPSPSLSRLPQPSITSPY